MHIPLDYYRVLGLPIQATASQLSHAHRDRTLQLPRREFSEWAIAARRQLIDEAYEVLSDPTQRQNYDASFFSKPYDMAIASSPSSDEANHDSVDPNIGDPSVAPNPAKSGGANPSAAIPRIEIHDHQFIGALLLLYELGEYELALKLGRPYLAGGEKSLANGQLGDPQIVSADIVLTIALSCLELGREQWQQGQYEAAAESLETGQELLLREGLFVSVRGEIQTDLYKLRPYRILELLALPEDRQVERYQGLRLLHDILEERGGIDGKGNDQSGLNTDDFLRFIQQLRTYLSVTEQQQIFEVEANRPSAVGTYLTVYTLIAGGFAHRQPALIQSAKQYLNRLGNRQDVRLEQSICALLLGQTEEANYLVEHSHEQETLAYIRKHSADSPDLLPGLCLYTEQWFRTEVFPQFRDLLTEDAALKGYFADPSVQAYLEALPSVEDERVAAPPMMASTTPSARLHGQEAVAYQGGGDRYQTSTTQQQHSSAFSSAQGGSIPSHATTRVGTGVSATATRDEDYGGSHASLNSAQRVAQLSPPGNLTHPPEATATRGDTPGLAPNQQSVPYGTTLTPRHRGQSGPRIDRLLLLA
ncbi:MAG: J domain-containing protein, partial [Leptolyngbyaceae bacterium]|nr:J domain-containing protein [Leptolyngbyaceae bacterium]